MVYLYQVHASTSSARTASELQVAQLIACTLLEGATLHPLINRSAAKLKQFRAYSAMAKQREFQLVALA